MWKPWSCGGVFGRLIGDFETRPMDTPSRPARDTLDSRKAHDRMHRSRIEEHWQVFSVYKVDQTALQWSMARERKSKAGDSYHI